MIGGRPILVESEDSSDQLAATRQAHLNSVRKIANYPGDAVKVNEKG